jgi:hypothetical protein
VIRNAINAGDIPGPRYLANGKEMARRDGDLVAGITAYADGPDEMREVIRHHAQLDVDNIKLSMSGEEVSLQASPFGFHPLCNVGIDKADSARILLTDHRNSLGPRLLLYGRRNSGMRRRSSQAWKETMCPRSRQRFSEDVYQGQFFLPSSPLPSPFTSPTATTIPIS